jgi:YspA, cpYpsA-related SLOG family
MVNHRALTAAMIDSREFIAARKRADAQLLAPAGTRIAFTGGTDCNDIDAIWAALDKVRARHPDMVLLHGGSPKGAERIAACWADNRKVPQIAFKPNWNRDRNAAPFRRNDRMLEALPIGVVVFQGSGISANLADKAQKMGIPVARFDQPARAGNGA